jgi:glutamyl-tRNA reductase
MIELEAWGPDRSIGEREAQIRRLSADAPPKPDQVHLITCDRVEIYRGDGMASPEIAAHLFSLAGGLLSPLLGENAILGQIRRAYETYRICLNHYLNPDLQSISQELSGYPRHSKGLHILFQAALACGKLIRTQTEINRGAISYAQATVDLIRQRRQINRARILLVAANELNGDILMRLQNSGANCCLISRNLQKAKDLALANGASWASIEELCTHTVQAEVIISATSAPHEVFHPGLHQVQAGALLIDLAVPRDFNPAFATVAELVDVPQLEATVEQHRLARTLCVEQAQLIVQSSVSAYLNKAQKIFIR